MSEWQPIETAPKKGQILIFDALDNLMFDISICVWNGVEWEEAGFGGECGTPGDGLKMENPTHWMPLPKPPTSWVPIDDEEKAA